MTKTANIREEAPDDVIIRKRAGVWRVSFNGVFYGDYARRSWAIEAALEKAEAIARNGRAATVALAKGGDERVLLFDTRRPTHRHEERAHFWPLARSTQERRSFADSGASRIDRPKRKKTRDGKAGAPALRQNAADALIYHIFARP